MPSSPFLNNFINSLSSKQRIAVSTLLQSAIVSKSDIAALASTVSNQTNLTSFIPVGQAAGGKISGNDWFLNFRNINLYLAELFTNLNAIGLLLDTNQKILLSQLAAAEKQLSSLEKQAANFEFLLGSGNSYNYSYTESFHDTLGMATNLGWSVPDRDGLGFNTDFQTATVLTASGSLILPQDTGTQGAGLTAKLIQSNAEGFVVTDTGIANTLNTASNTGWQYIVASPNPINAQIDPIFANSAGLQVILEYTLTQPSSCSQIQITPLASELIEIADIIAYTSSSDTVGFSIRGSTNISINQNTILSFPLTTIERFRIFLRQPEYSRVISNQSESNNQFNRLYQQSGAADKTLNDLGYDDISFNALAESIEKFPTFSNTGLTATKPDVCDVLRTFRTRVGPQSQWTANNVNCDSFLSLYTQWPNVYKTTFLNSLTTPDVFNSFRSIPQLASVTNNPTPPTSTLPMGTTNLNTSNDYSYQYTIGLQSIQIGVAIPEYKGVFVSNVIPSDGSMGIVVLSATDSNYIDTTDRLDNPVLTSVEYSITNVSNPQNESDWTAILPLNDTTVTAERLFPNVSGFCQLRFIADSTEPLFVYKNGYIFDQYIKQLDATDNNVVGISLLAKTYVPQDVFTISYTPIIGLNTVNFASAGFANLPLLSASDRNGTGEGFSATVGNNLAQLSNLPFINVSQLNSGTYQPITVVLNDGTIATNLTNYITGVQPAFPATGISYIQSNNILLFNQPISQSFRVYYQYLQNNVRFRVILRSNSINLVSPTVSLVQIKAETILPNAIQAI